MINPSSIECRVGARLLALGHTVAAAESCSGGLVAHRITNVPGSSAYFLGGVVAYSCKVKTALLGVSKTDLAKFGAVSEPVARQMAEGARKRLGSDFAVATTGIAGPDGGTATKPVGLVYVAVAGPNETVVRRNAFAGTRLQIKEQTAAQALGLLLECVA